MEGDTGEEGGGWLSIFIMIVQNIMRLALLAFYGFVICLILKQVKQQDDKIKTGIGHLLKMGISFGRKIYQCLKNKYQIKIDQLFSNQVQISKYGVVSLAQHPIPRAIMAMWIEQGKHIIGICKKLIKLFQMMIEFFTDQYTQFASSDQIKRLRMLQSLKCPLSKSQLVDPVMINQCGHTFERSFIQKKLTQVPQCPICKIGARRINLKQNYPIKQIIRKLNSLSDKKTTTKTVTVKNNNSILIMLSVFLIIIILYLLIIRPQPAPITISPINNLNDLLLKRFNIVDKNIMAQGQFETKKNAIINLFNGNNIDSKFITNINGKMFEGAVTLQTVKQQQFYVHYKVKGVQLKGSWQGDAYLLTKKGGLYFWMHITNFNGRTALQKQQQDLIYESYIVKQNIDDIKGKWYYLGHVTDPNLSGDWRIFDMPTIKQQNVSANPTIQSNIDGRNKNDQPVQNKYSTQLKQKLQQVEVAQQL